MRTRLLVLGLTLALPGAAPAATPAGGLKLPPYQRVVLPNGLTLLLMEQHEVPLIAVSAVVRTGSVADPAGKEGVAFVTALLLRKGTKLRDADRFSEELDSIGATFGAEATWDSTDVSAEFMAKDLERGLDLVVEALTRPIFPEQELDKLIKQQVDGIKAAKDRARTVLGTYYGTFLYGRHPYGRPPDGDERSLPAITREDVVSFHTTYYTPGNTILAVAGDFERRAMQKRLAAALDGWRARRTPVVALPTATPVRGKKLLLVDKPDSTQTFFSIGNIGIEPQNPDRVAISVVNTLFGGRFTSMINSELRIRSGLTYGAFSSFERRKAKGPFVITSFTSNASTEKALDLTLDVLKRLHEKGLSEEELQSAKAYLKGQFPPTLETPSQLADLLAELVSLGFDQREVDEYYARLDAVTRADVRRVIEQYFPLDNLAFTLIGKATEIEGVARKYAPQVERKSITDPGF